MDFISSLRIVLNPESIWIYIPEILHHTFEITDVLFGPFELKPDAT